MRLLKVTIPAQYIEINLNGYYGSDEELDFDSLYDGFIHEIVSNPDYTYEVVEAED